MTSWDAETDFKPIIIIIIMKAVQIPNMPDDLKRTIVNTVPKFFFEIYCNRNNTAMDAA